MIVGPLLFSSQRPSWKDALALGSLPTLGFYPSSPVSSSVILLALPFSGSSSFCTPSLCYLTRYHSAIPFFTMMASLVLVCLVKWEIHSYLNCCFLTSITSFVFGFFQKVLFLLLLLLLFSGVAVSITQGCEFLWVYLCEICWTSWKCGFLSFAKCEDCTAIFFFSNNFFQWPLSLF